MAMFYGNPCAIALIRVEKLIHITYSIIIYWSLEQFNYYIELTLSQIDDDIHFTARDALTLKVGKFELLQRRRRN